MHLLEALVSARHKDLRLLYYARNVLGLAVPSALYRRRLDRRLAEIVDHDEGQVLRRVDYCNRLEPGCVEPARLASLRDFRFPKRLRTYYFDCRQYLRYFDPELRASFLFGDITHVPPVPTILKSRPIHGENANSVLLKLDKLRHFVFLKDPRPLATKLDRLVGRSVAKQPHRRRFLERYHGHPLCDVGQINRDGQGDRWLAPRLSIDRHLDHKFILCLEGFDVATNLKWVMSSNSLAVMPPPTYETWFMEGTLLPDHHYVAIKPDYSDLEERLRHYMAHPAEAQRIVENAHAYVDQFRDRAREDLISLLVLQKYFERTGQRPPAARSD